MQPEKVSIARLENDKLVEFVEDSNGKSFSVGNIYLAKVHKLMPGLNAAFVNVGYEKDAFLHYLDLGLNFASINDYVKNTRETKNKQSSLSRVKLFPELPKDGLISGVLTQGQEILVQVSKEPISTKGPRLTTEISLAGRFMVLLPFTDRVSVSSKIKSSSERSRLIQLVKSIKPKNFGVIIRTVAEEKKVAELDAELRVLIKRWKKLVSRLDATNLPLVVREESNKVVGLLRDGLNSSFRHVYVNDAKEFDEIKSYIELVLPDKEDIVELYKEESPIFDHYGVTKQIKSSFGRAVSYKNGAYLIIDHAEALHVIDVNSGNRNKKNKGQEDNALDVNLYAADEIARQLRLRDMGGIIIVDFIDMLEASHRKELFDRMINAMRNDKATHNILPLTKFGLMQITRHRVRPQIDIETMEVCPTCKGKGKIMPSLLFVDELQSKVEYLSKELHVKKFTLNVHPYVYAYIKQGGFKSILWKWKRKYGFGVKVMQIQSYAYLEYEFINSEKKKIEMEK